MPFDLLRTSEEPANNMADIDPFPVLLRMSNKEAGDLQLLLEGSDGHLRALVARIVTRGKQLLRTNVFNHSTDYIQAKTKAK